MNHKSISLQALLAAGLSFCTTFASAAGSAPLQHQANDDEVEVAHLIKRNTADALATASLFAHIVDTSTVLKTKPDPTDLINKAVAMAPKRPELVWLQLRECEVIHCMQRAQFAARLHELDATNGVIHLSDLSEPEAQDPAKATVIINEIANSPYLNIYWNKLLVMMFDATTPSGSVKPTALTRDADDRLSHAIGVLTAISVRPFKPLSVLCKSDQFAQSGRRAACERLMPRLDDSDSVIAQALSPSLQEGWYSQGTAKNNIFRAKRMQLIYLVQASNRERGNQVNDDATRRVDAMRRLPREEDVEKAMLTAFKEPLERPDGWSSVTAVE